MRRAVLVAAAVLAVAGCSERPSIEEREQAARDRAEALVTEVLYEVEGTTGSVSITIKTPSGTSQQTGLAVPLTTESGRTGLRFTFNAGDFVYISAQGDENGGSVICRITADGKVISEVRSGGPHTIATCDGTA